MALGIYPYYRILDLYKYSHYISHIRTKEFNHHSKTVTTPRQGISSNPFQKKNCSGKNHSFSDQEKGKLDIRVLVY